MFVARRVSFPQLVLICAVLAAFVACLRRSRGAFVATFAERERLARTAAGLVMVEVGDAAGIGITGRSGDLHDLEVLGYVAAPGSPPAHNEQRVLLPRDEAWSVTGPASRAPAGDAHWIIWWTCPSGYRWRLNVRDRKRHGPHLIARPLGSAPRTNDGLARLRDRAWPYAYPTPRPHRDPSRPTPRALLKLRARGSAEPVEVTLVELCGLEAYSEDETVDHRRGTAPTAPARTSAEIAQKP